MLVQAWDQIYHRSHLDVKARVGGQQYCRTFLVKKPKGLWHQRCTRVALWPHSRSRTYRILAQPRRRYPWLLVLSRGVLSVSMIRATWRAKQGRRYIPINLGSARDLSANCARLVPRSWNGRFGEEIMSGKPSSTATLSAAFCNGWYWFHQDLAIRGLITLGIMADLSIDSKKIVLRSLDRVPWICDFRQQIWFYDHGAGDRKFDLLHESE